MFKYKCDLCDYQTNRKFNLNIHKNRVKSCDSETNLVETIIDNKVSCKTCLKVFSNKSCAIKHEKNCKGVNTLRCNICHKCFINKKALGRHLQNVICVNDNQNTNIVNIQGKQMTISELVGELNKLKSDNSSAGINISNDNSVITNTNTMHDNSQITTNTNNGIIMNHYLKPNIDFMNDMEYVHNLLTKSKYRTNKVIMKCVRDTYNSDDRPENKSIKINLKSGFAEVNIGKRKINVPNDDACYDVLFNMSKDIKKVVEDYSYTYNMSGSKVDDIIDQIEDVECDNVDTNKLYGSYVKAGLI
jgi:hypothetical protein